VLDRKHVEVQDERSSRARPLTDREVRELLGQVSRVIVARGPTSRVLPAGAATLDDLRGPSGNFRAPLIRKGKTLVVGFNAAVLDEVL
jgi:hypothetical protein